MDAQPPPSGNSSGGQDDKDQSSTSAAGSSSAPSTSAAAPASSGAEATKDVEMEAAAVDDGIPDDLRNASPDDILARARMLDNEIRVSRVPCLMYMDIG